MFYAAIVWAWLKANPKNVLYVVLVIIGMTLVTKGYNAVWERGAAAKQAEWDTAVRLEEKRQIELIKDADLFYVAQSAARHTVDAAQALSAQETYVQSQTFTGACDTSGSIDTPADVKRLYDIIGKR